LHTTHPRIALVLCSISIPIALAAFCSPARGADYAVNAYMPFPVGSPRVMGMGGAFTGIAAGAEAIVCNPVAVMRPDAFAIGPVDVDYMLSFATSSETRPTDFGNVGQVGDEVVTVGGLGFIGRWRRPGRYDYGLGIYLSSETYEYEVSGGTASLQLTAPRLVYGRAFYNEQLFLSMALDVSNPDFDFLPSGGTPGVDEVTVEYQSVRGVPFEVGVLWRPWGHPFQIGARVKGERRSATEETIPTVDPFPDKVVYPGEWALGCAFRLGHRAPEGAPCWFDMALIDVDVRGVFPVSGTTGFENFRQATPAEVLEDPLVQPAVGLEVELYSKKAWLWLGSYYEPERYDGVGGRAHLTWGMKLKLGEAWDIPFYFAFANDSAERYNVWVTSLTTAAGKF